MNLDNLISKYLDGELTRDEDRELRRILAEDPVARETFGEFVELNYMFKEDASETQTPSDLKNHTEDKVLMRILSNSADNGMLFPQQEERKKRRRLVPVAILVLTGFLSLFFVDSFDQPQPETAKINFSIELPELVNPTIETSDSNQENDTQSKSTQINNSVISSNKITLKKSNIAYVSSEESEEYSQIQNQLKDQNNQTSNIDQSQANLEIKNVIDSKEEILNIVTTDLFANALSINSKNSNINSLQEQSIGFIGNDRFVVSSNAGNELFKAGYNPESQNMVNNFNQSISLKLNDNQRVGVELGVQDYVFNQMQRVLLPWDGIYDPYMDGIISNGQIATTLETTQNYRRVWAMLFMDNRIWHSNSFDLFSRVGVGATTEGPMFSGNLYLEYEIINGLGFIAGVDLRFFEANYNKFVGQSSGYKFNTNLIYGFNFKF